MNPWRRTAGMAAAAGLLLAGSAVARTARAQTAGGHVWNLDLLAVEPVALPDPPPPPAGVVRLVAPRNGQASAKVMVGGAAPVPGLRASTGDLAGPAGTIPAAQIRIYYGTEWRDMARAWNRPVGLDILLDQAPDDRPTVAVWCVLHVPRETAPGLYRGRLHIDTADGPLAEVPLELQVADWTLPEPEAMGIWNDLVQSPDTLAEEYGLPLWSEAHWALIERSFRLIRPLAGRTLYIPLICQTNLGNAESMVRWIPDGTGGYRFDFGVMERYLDLALAHAGRPEAVVFNVWDVYQAPADNRWTEAWWNGLSPQQQRNRYFIELYERGQLLRELQAQHGTGPVVSVVLDGEVTAVPMAPYTAPEERAQWSALFAQLRQRLAARGLEGAMTLGMLTDSWPTREEAAALHEIGGGLPWASHAHWSAFRRRGGTVHGLAPVGFESVVWDLVFRDPADPERLFGWRREERTLAHYRLRGFNGFHPGGMRTVLELNLAGNQRGLGRVGMDFWWVLRDPRGARRGTISLRYPQSLWRNLDIQASVLAPGPDGPQPTARYRYLVEGLQEAEARIAVERALLDPDGTPDGGLAERAWALLDERQRAAWRCAGRDDAFYEEEGHTGLRPHQREVIGAAWFSQSGWLGRTAALYELAGEVERRLNRPHR